MKKRFKATIKFIPAPLVLGIIPIKQYNCLDIVILFPCIEITLTYKFKKKGL